MLCSTRGPLGLKGFRVSIDDQRKKDYVIKKDSPRSSPPKARGQTICLRNVLKLLEEFLVQVPISRISQNEAEKFRGHNTLNINSAASSKPSSIKLEIKKNRKK